jgi:hypothetical protein
MLRERPRDELGSLGSLNTDELSTVRYLDVEVDDALEIAEVDVRSPGAELPCSADLPLGRVRAKSGSEPRTDI